MPVIKLSLVRIQSVQSRCLRKLVMLMLGIFHYAFNRTKMSSSNTSGQRSQTSVLEMSALTIHFALSVSAYGTIYSLFINWFWPGSRSTTNIPWNNLLLNMAREGIAEIMQNSQGTRSMQPNDVRRIVDAQEFLANMLEKSLFCFQWSSGRVLAL